MTDFPLQITARPILSLWCKRCISPCASPGHSGTWSVFVSIYVCTGKFDKLNYRRLTMWVSFVKEYLIEM